MLSAMASAYRPARARGNPGAVPAATVAAQAAASGLETQAAPGQVVEGVGEAQVGIGQFTEGSQGDAIFFSKCLKKCGEVLVWSFHVI
jgi:hypothetical protein